MPPPKGDRADLGRMNEDFREIDGGLGTEADAHEVAAIRGLETFFESHPNQVFFSRQLEVRHESQWFHWITNRALRDLADRGDIQTEARPLAHGGNVMLIWPRGYRYYRRDAARLIRLIEEYADPNIGAALGLQGEAMVLEGFARKQFVMHGRGTKSFEDRHWRRSAHDLDFIFERDGIAYGIEVKNTLGYMDHEEMLVKIELCRDLGLRPIFAARMLPKSWVKEINDAGGFALVLKYQLYPWTHRDLAKRVREALELPVDAPRCLADGTMERFLRWHSQQS